MTTSAMLNVHSPALPRAAHAASALFHRLSAGLSGSIARLSTPRPLTRTQEAARVRELAARVQANDPGFAADLYGAAMRHESFDER